MFWKKKNTVEYDGLPITLSKLDVFNRFTGEKTKQFLAYRHGNEWRGLVGYEQYKEEQELRDKLSCKIEQKLDLILDHLNLEYVPEIEKKEPAKLVDRKEEVIKDDRFPFFRVIVEDEPKKKKRGRPKKK